MTLNVSGLYKSYGGRHVLTDIHFGIKSGIILGLVGDNGAGKSTLLKCISGAEQFDHGQITIDGVAHSVITPELSRSIGIAMIYQNLDLCPQQDVITNIFLGQEKTIRIFGQNTPFLNRSHMKDLAIEVLNRLGLDVDISQNVSLLSGGQQQRIAIARALISHPKILIMDEPTAALGIRESKKLLDMVRNLKMQGIAIIFVSHKIQDIYDVSDRILMMRQGKIITDLNKNDISLAELHKIMMNEEV